MLVYAVAYYRFVCICCFVILLHSFYLMPTLYSPNSDTSTCPNPFPFPALNPLPLSSPPLIPPLVPLIPSLDCMVPPVLLLMCECAVDLTISDFFIFNNFLSGVLFCYVFVFCGYYILGHLFYFVWVGDWEID